jgi:hypothetical protein
MQKVHRYFVDNAEIYGINSWIDWINQRNRESTDEYYLTIPSICRSVNQLGNRQSRS